MPKQYAPLPSVKQILEHFTYDRSRGALLWRGDTEATKYLNDRYVGQVAGSVSKSGYLRVKFLGKSYLVHRLIFKIEHGRDPVAEVDHRDLDTLNNCGANLREASVTQNTWNRKNKERMYDLPKGVTLHKRSGKYRARIQAHGRRFELGDFVTVEKAVAAYISASATVHGAFGRTA